MSVSPGQHALHFVFFFILKSPQNVSAVNTVMGRRLNYRSNMKSFSLCIVSQMNVIVMV